MTAKEATGASYSAAFVNVRLFPGKVRFIIPSRKQPRLNRHLEPLPLARELSGMKHPAFYVGAKTLLWGIDELSPTFDTKLRS
jgi:hypothetical protein